MLFLAAHAVAGSFGYGSLLSNNPPTLSAWVETLNPSGSVTILGVDTAQPPASTPFTFVWGDGSATTGYFPQAHTYVNPAQNYIVTITIHENSGGTQQVQVPVLFSAGLAISPQTLPSNVIFRIPSQPVPFSTRDNYPLPTGVTAFPDSAFTSYSRANLQYLLTAASDIAEDFANDNVFLMNGTFEIDALQIAAPGTAASFWYTSPMSVGFGSGILSPSVAWSLAFWGIGIDTAVNTPVSFPFGGNTDGNAAAIYSQTMAGIFLYSLGYELINNASSYGIGNAVALDMGNQLLSQAAATKASFNAYVAAGAPFSSWNPGTGADPTAGTISALQWKFIQHAESAGAGYRTPLKRLMQFFQMFNPTMLASYDPHNNSVAGATYRSTLMVTGLSYAFSSDLRAEFRALNFPIDDSTYQQLYNQVPPLPSNTDLAQGQPATQSSTMPGTPAAGVAVDGNTDGNFFDGSVTATNFEANPWWQVDLGSTATISSVVVWNRTDCCASRLGDYWVFVSNTPFLATDTPATLQSRAGTFASHQTAAPNPSTSIPVGAQGRYVRVQLNAPNYLSLAEVQVFGSSPCVTQPTLAGCPNPTVDVALGRPASQSTTYPGSPPASVAVDGVTDGNYFDGSVTATNFEANPWWQVDLGTSTTISSLVIWNRTDCCGSRLNDYWVFVSDTPFLATDTPATLQSRAGTYSSLHETSAPNPSTVIAPWDPCLEPHTGACPTFVTAGPQGRYVRIQLTNPNVLSLAEVQIFGTGGTPVSKVASESSQYPGSPPASVAIDGSTDGNYFDGSVTSTNYQAYPWWEVDLGASQPVNWMSVWGRTDCCQSRLSDFFVFVSDTPFLATDTPATLLSRPGTAVSHQQVAPNPVVTIGFSGVTGRYVRVQLNGTNYLSLAEVEVVQ